MTDQPNITPQDLLAVIGDQHMQLRVAQAQLAEKDQEIERLRVVVDEMTAGPVDSRKKERVG